MDPFRFTNPGSLLPKLPDFCAEVEKVVAQKTMLNKQEIHFMLKVLEVKRTIVYTIQTTNVNFCM